MKLSYKELFINFLIYLLTFILIAFIATDFYKYISKNSNKTHPRNSISVSPLTGQRIQEVTTSNALLEVEYSSKRLKDLSYIDEADILYETYLRTTNTLMHRGVFYNKKIIPSNSIEAIKTLDLSSLPKLEFMDSLELNKYNFKTDCDTIFIEYSKTVSSSFTYNGEDYVHYTDSSVDKHPITNKPLAFSNVLVQYISKEPDEYKKNLTVKGDGEGILFSKGKRQQVYWHDNSFFLEDKKTPLTLSKGNTFWIKTDKFTDVITSKCLVYTSNKID